MKKHGTTILLIIILSLGIVLLLYPTVSNWWNQQHQSRAIASYSESIENLDEHQVDEFLTKANEFNQLIKSKHGLPFLSDEEMQRYEETLDITDTGVMAYIEIPILGVSLPVHHGVSESVLQIAVGHLEWTSLPIGGESTHCVLSGHRGLPSAKLFTNLDRLGVGDVFMLNILDSTITYQVDQVLIVEPKDISSLKIEEGKDLCTLVTCTPYGINSHRLLVRGTRIENLEETPVINVIAEAGQIEPLLIAPIVAAPLLLLLLIYVMLKYRKKK